MRFLAAAGESNMVRKLHLLMNPNEILTKVTGAGVAGAFTIAYFNDTPPDAAAAHEPPFQIVQFFPVGGFTIAAGSSNAPTMSWYSGNLA